MTQPTKRTPMRIRVCPRTQLWRIMKADCLRLAGAACGELDASDIREVLLSKYAVSVPSCTLSRWLRSAGLSARRGRPAGKGTVVVYEKYDKKYAKK